MPKGQEPTTKFRVDISELKQNMQAAQREIRLANAEFKAATAGMDNWADSADGLSEKLKQLEKTESAQQKQLDLLREQHRLVVAEQGENSKAAQELEIKIKNQEAAVGKTAKSIQDFKGKLEEATDGSKDLAKAVEDASESADDAEDGFTVLKGALASLVADGIRAATDAFKELLVAGDQAMGSFQAKTGASADEMERFSEEINELYKNNFGEDLGDVADAMANVAQNTKEVDPSKIRELTENALTLRDTFGWEVNETMRAANMLMDQFGITGDEAFALIAQGAQNGLDKNGDLLDSINEYGVHYKQLGFTAEGFFNSLQNGTEAGTFSVDKLGDAVKEFGIRIKDTSDGTSDTLRSLGYGAVYSTDAFQENAKIVKDLNKELSKTTDSSRKAELKEQIAIYEEFRETMIQTNKENIEMNGTIEDLQTKIAAGGEGAQEAIQGILTKLFAIEDPILRNAEGVTLFGTMWEDLGEDGIKALMNIDGAANKTADTMNEIKSVKYADIGSQLAEIGRMIQVDFIAPLAETALPLLKEGLTWVKENLDTLIPVITGIGTAIATAFAINAIGGFIGTIGTLVTAVKGATTVAGALKAGMAALNITMTMNPIGLVVAAIAGLVAAFVVLWNKSDDFRNFWIALWNKIKTVFTDVITMVNNKMTEWGAKLIAFATTTIPQFITKVVEWFGSLPTKIQKWLSEALAKVIVWGSDMITKGKQAAIDTVNGVIDAFFGLPDKLFEVGSNALTGFWDGLKSVGSSIKKWATNFFNSILEKAEEVLEIHSPSRAFRRIAEYTMEGFDDGLTSGSKSVMSHVRDTFVNVRNGASEALGGLSGGSGAFGANSSVGVTGIGARGSQIVYNFNQTNNSPKSLSRLEIYRQSKNLLNRGRVYV